MASTNVPDPARARLETLGSGPPPTRAPISAWGPPGAAEPDERIGWPTAAPGTPAARLRFAARGALPEPLTAPVREPPWGSTWDHGDGHDPEPDVDPDPGPDVWAAARTSGEAWGGRWAERWVPASWRGARWDPGRAGAVALAAVAAVAAVVAAVGVWSGRPVAEPVPPLPSVSTAASSGPASGPVPATTPGGPIVVSVSGKVAHPGLLRLPEGSRIGEAVAAAGGPVPGVDLTALNLAQRLADGEQVVVGAPAAPPPAAPAASGNAGVPSGRGHGAASSAPGDKVNLNTATLEQLDQLPGVGPVTAQKILDWRTQNGRFSSVEQLQEVGGIGEARLATLRPRVEV